MISLANGALITRPLIACEFIGLNVLNSQSIRWRKPMWMGTAKSKIFRVPARQVIPKEETMEIMRLNNNYRTYRESLRRYFMDLTIQNEVQFDEETLRKAEEEDFAQCSKLNDQWNDEVKKSREKREYDALEARKVVVLESIVAKEERDKKMMNEIEERVRKAKAESRTFITEKNIDEAIEIALANVVNYNFSIDSEGNRYEGKYEPVDKQTQSREKIHAQQ